jgi:hypothetical protein
LFEGEEGEGWRGEGGGGFEKGREERGGWSEEGGGEGIIPFLINVFRHGCILQRFVFSNLKNVN